MMHRVIYNNHASSTAIANGRDALWFVGHGLVLEGAVGSAGRRRGRGRERRTASEHTRHRDEREDKETPLRVPLGPECSIGLLAPWLVSQSRRAYSATLVSLSASVCLPLLLVSLSFRLLLSSLSLPSSSPSRPCS